MSVACPARSPKVVHSPTGSRLVAGPALAAVAIVGASGYSGALLAELLLRHPAVALTHLSSEQLAGQSVSRHLPRLRTPLDFCAAQEVGGVDVAFVCTPHGQAAPVVQRLLDGGARVVDLSADFRLEPAVYADWYGRHACPELTPAPYGLTELHRDEVSRAVLVANPGCYATAALLALAPLKPLDLLDVIIDAKSGVSGAGKVPDGRTHFCSVDSDLLPYAVAAHRHHPEIEAELQGLGAAPSPFGCAAAPPVPSLTFVPHLVPLQRGISETIYVRLGTLPLPSKEALAALYEEAYGCETFVHVCDEPPQLKDVAGTNDCRIFPTVDERAGRVIVVSVIDNLMKGAAGQAVQNMNVMLGLPETWGLQ